MDFMCGMKGGCGGSKLLWGLVIIGALNWGLFGLFGLDLVDLIFGRWDIVARIVYVLVGLAGAIILFGGCKCKKCKMEGKGCGGDGKCCK